MDPLISVIVPIFNAQQYMEKCIDSILKQTYEKLEIILVDDGSTDSSLSICQEYAQKDDRIIVISKSNGGVSSARNVGINIAKGKYIAFVDSDDWIEHSSFEFLLNTSKEFNADVVIHPMIFESPNRQFTSNVSEEIITFDKVEAICEVLLERKFGGHFPNKFFKRELFPQNIFDEEVHVYEDLLAIVNIFMRCNKVIYINKYFYHYRMNNESAMHQPYNNKYLTIRIAAKKIEDLVKKNFADKTEYTNLLKIRINYNICNKAYQQRYYNKSIFNQEFTNLRSILIKSYSAEVRKLCNNRERIFYDIAKKGKFTYLLFNLLLDIYHKFRLT